MWVSPDKKIRKDIITEGKYGLKPSENSVCTIELSDVSFLNEDMPSEYIFELERYPLELNIGEANTELDREIDKCLQMMEQQEFSLVKITFPDNEITFKLKLCHFESHGFICEWNAKDKFLLAQKHKDKGIELFKGNRFVDAAFRFSKGLRILLSIPIPVENPPDEIDGIEIAEIDKFKANLFNNLASCNIKVKDYVNVIDLCSKVLEIDKNNVKALYKRGFAYAGTRAFEKAHNDLTKVLSLDSENQAAKDKLQVVELSLNQQEANYNTIVKKMFGK